MDTDDLTEVDRAKVNLETAQIAWRDLQTFFAGGSVIYVKDGLDLVEVAFQVSADNAEQVREWVTASEIGQVIDEQALAWFEADALVWAVVARPYVFVQSGSETD